MKNSWPLFSIFLLCLGNCLLSGCEKSNEAPNCGVESIEYVFFENSFLDIQYPTTQTIYPSVQISEEEGGNTVFQYLRYVDESNCPWSDGGQGDWVVFEVEGDLTEFNFEDEELMAANAFAGGYSGIGGRFMMQAAQQGKITGKKLNQSKWHVSVDISVNGHSYQLEENFKLE